MRGICAGDIKIKNVQMFNGAWPGPSKASVKAFVLAASRIVSGRLFHCLMDLSASLV